MYDLILLYLESAKNALSFFPSVDARFYVSIALFIASSFVWFGFRTVRRTDHIASLLFEPLGNDRCMQSRIVWVNTFAMGAFTLYLLAFLLSRVKLCQASAAVADGLFRFNPSECTRLTAWFQPNHLLLARAMLEVVTISLGAFWVLYKHCKSWSTFRLVMTLSALIGVQIIESGSVLYYDSESYRKSTLLFITRICASISYTTVLALNYTKLSKWQKAFAQPIIVLHPEKNIWYPNDEVQLDDVKNQYKRGSAILTYHYLYHMYIHAATWDFIPLDLSDPYSLSHNSMLVFIGSLLAIFYLGTYQKMARDKRLDDPNLPPEGRLPFILVLNEGRVVACTAENRAELELGRPSSEHLFELADLEGTEIKAEDLV